MSKQTVRLFTLSALLIAGSLQASAQTATSAASTTESVTVMGSRRAFHVTSARSFGDTEPGLSGKMARWEAPRLSHRGGPE